jgi:hypothetical protein
MHILNILKRFLFSFAALWSIGVGIYLLVVPFHKVMDGNGNVRSETLYELNGLRVVVILIIFTLIFSSIGILATKGRQIVLTILNATLSLLAMTLTMMAMFTR